jgi:hypothetical protein
MFFFKNLYANIEYLDVHAHNFISEFFNILKCDFAQ